jgi:hypothetical protein
MMKSFRFALTVAFLVSILSATGVRSQLSWGSTPAKDESVVALEARAEIVLDTAENVIERTWRLTRKHRHFVKGLTGGLVLAYGEVL